MLLKTFVFGVICGVVLSNPTTPEVSLPAGSYSDGCNTIRVSPDGQMASTKMACTGTTLPMDQWISLSDETTEEPHTETTPGYAPGLYFSFSIYKLFSDETTEEPYMETTPGYTPGLYFDGCNTVRITEEGYSITITKVACRNGPLPMDQWTSLDESNTTPMPVILSSGRYNDGCNTVQVFEDGTYSPLTKMACRNGPLPMDQWTKEGDDTQTTTRVPLEPGSYSDGCNTIIVGENGNELTTLMGCLQPTLPRDKWIRLDAPATTTAPEAEFVPKPGTYSDGCNIINVSENGMMSSTMMWCSTPTLKPKDWIRQN